ncbi:ANTAR domain-containing response regulator [Fundicoccus culcitae]
MLEQSGYNVVAEAGDGFEAIQLAQKHHPDIVIMDIKMPLLDGLTASKRIMAEDLTSGIILLTAYSDTKFIEKAKEFGASGYLIKPLNEGALIPMVELSLAKGEEFKQMSQEIKKLNKKLSERKTIEKAKGKLMDLENLTEEEAYQKIRTISMEKRVPMIDIAETLVLIDER